MENIIQNYNKNPRRVDIYQLDKLKIALDDLLTTFLVESGYKENHKLLDIQNIVGIISSICAAVVCYLSVYRKFEDVKRFISLFVYIYFAINSISFAISYVYGGVIKFDNLNVVTEIDKIPVYTALFYKKNSTVPIKYKKSVYDLFDENGKLDHELFLNDIQKALKN